MADTVSYIAQMLAGSGLRDRSIEEIIASLGGQNNPSSFAYTPMTPVDVNVPVLMSIADYLNKTGATGYQYDYNDILDALNNATELEWQATQNAQRDMEDAYYRAMANEQQTAADTIQNQYAQAIQSGITKGLQNANLLSTILGTQQTGNQELIDMLNQRYQAGREYAASLGNNVNQARAEANAALETLLGNIRQLYNDDIQRETAELEYNASVGETNANAAAQKYAADTNYASGVLTNATNQRNQLLAALAQIAAQGANSAAQDNYSNAYANKASAAASAQSVITTPATPEATVTVTKPSGASTTISAPTATSAPAVVATTPAPAKPATTTTSNNSVVITKPSGATVTVKGGTSSGSATSGQTNKKVTQTTK